jgi:hypothetical protein
MDKKEKTIENLKNQVKLLRDDIIQFSSHEVKVRFYQLESELASLESQPEEKEELMYIIKTYPICNLDGSCWFKENSTDSYCHCSVECQNQNNK